MNKTPFRYFKRSPEVISLAVMMNVRLPLSLWNFEVLLYERGNDLSQEKVRFLWNRFGPMFAVEIRKKCADQTLQIKQQGFPAGALGWHLQSYLRPVRPR